MPLRSLRSGRDGVVAHEPCFKTHFETLRCERPPRRFAPPLLCKEGNVIPEISSKKQESIALLHKDKTKGRIHNSPCGLSLCRCASVFISSAAPPLDGGSP